MPEVVVLVNTRTYHGITVEQVAGGITVTPRWVAGPALPQGDQWFTRDHQEGDNALWIEGQSVPRFELLGGQDGWQPGDRLPRKWVSVFDRTRPPIDDDWLARAQGWPGVNPWKVEGSLRDAAASIAARLAEEASCTSS